MIENKITEPHKKTISDCKTLAEVTELRRELVEREKFHENDPAGLAVNINKEYTHFVYELLQNADDAGATEVVFDLKNNELIFYHNGPKDFTLKDIISITGIHNSTKKTDKNTIGKFGIGFKSVYRITDTPYIYNRAFNFRIDDMQVPVEEKPLDSMKYNETEYTTITKLPFLNKNYSNDKLYQKIQEELNKLDDITIIFLKNISKIIKNNSVVEIKRIKSDCCEKIENTKSQIQYWKFKDNESGVSIMYSTKDGKIIKSNNPYLFSYLITGERSGLYFDIDAPFELNPARESLMKDSDVNENLFDKIAKLFRKSLLILRDKKIIDESFISILPISIDEYQPLEIKKRLHEELKDIFKKEKILPTISHEYITSSEAIICNYPKMKELSHDGLENKKWLDINNNSVLSFLTNDIDIKKVSIAEFVEYFSKGLLDKKSLDWLREFYIFLCEYMSEDDIEYIKSLPIIKTLSGEFRSAYSKAGDELIFKRSNGLDDNQIVHKMFSSVKEKDDDETKEQARKLLKFLEKLGIQERSPSQTIKMDYLSHWDDTSDVEERKQLFKRMWQIYNEANTTEKESIISLLKDKKIFLCETGEFLQGNKIMYGNKEQRELFTDGPFLDQSVYDNSEKFDEKNNQSKKIGNQDFCEKLGMVFALPISKWESKERWYYSYHLPRIENKELSRYGVNSGNYWWFLTVRHEVPNFDAILDNLNIEKARLLIKLFKDTTIPRDEIIGFWQHPDQRNTCKEHKYIPADFIRKIDQCQWVPSGDGKLIGVYEILKTDFCKLFQLNEDTPFLKDLHFKPDAESTLPPELQKRLDIIEGIPSDKLEEIVKSFKESTDIEPCACYSDEDYYNEYPQTRQQTIASHKTLQQFSNNDIYGEDNSGIEKNTLSCSIADEQTFVIEDVNNIDKNNSPDKRQFLGKKAEEKIEEYLKDKYKEYNVKKAPINNKGYDFELHDSNGNIVKYIEAKNTTNNADTVKIPVTPSEWHKAQIEKDKYSICIYNPNNNDCFELNNPYQQYLDNNISIDISSIKIKLCNKFV